MKWLRVCGSWAAGLAALFSLSSCELPSDRLKVAFISNNPHEFWTIARSGTAAAARQFQDVDVEFYMPANGTAAEQHRIIEDLICKGVRGIALSPNDAANQSRVLNRIIPNDVAFITQDSDLPPSSKRRCYIGTDNVKAGRAVGQLVKEALPRGGKLIIFVGMLDVQNAQERRAGVVATLAGLPDTPGGSARAMERAQGPYPLTLGTGPKYTIYATMTDEANQSTCKKNAEDALNNKDTGDVECMVGLWAYNPPAILQAVRGHKVQGKVQIIGFDEDDLTLQGIKSGDIYATVVQNPYMFGFESVRILRHLVRYGTLPEPEDPMIHKRGTSYFVDHRIIRRKRDLETAGLVKEGAMYIDKKKGQFYMDVDTFHEDLKQKKR
jgi:ribose transport system substrate-binding protein